MNQRNYYSLFLHSELTVRRILEDISGVFSIPPGIAFCAKEYRTVISILSSGHDRDEELFALLRKRFGPSLVYRGDFSCAEILYRGLKDKNRTIVFAESCTGGGLGRELTEISGSSSVFWGSFVTYADDAKKRVLGVPETVLKRHGAVSPECVKAMAAGALKFSGADVAVAVSGIAGPGGGTAEKPVGTVWFGFAGRELPTLAKGFLFEGERSSVRIKSVTAGLLYGQQYQACGTFQE